MANSISNQGIRERAKVITPTVSTTLTEADSFLEVNIGTDALVITLPQIRTENIGTTYTFRNIAATGAAIITISPNATDAFIGGFPNVTAGGVATVNRASTSINKDWINTKATAIKGDWVTIKAIALTNWYIQGGQGIWASEV